MLDTLLTTLIRKIQQAGSSPEQKADAKVIARRFVRSVARIFVVLGVEMTPQNNKKRL